MRHRPRVDRNHAEVVDALRKIGATVQSLAALGGGVPDLLVSRHGRTVVFEVKDGKLPPSRRALTHDELEWLAEWQGEKHVVLSAEEAVELMLKS